MNALRKSYRFCLELIITFFEKKNALNYFQFKSCNFIEYFSEKSTMLGNFPVELIEEILLYLGIVDLIVMLKTNKRLYSITHNEKSPLRHKLVQRDFNINLYFTKGSDEQYGEDECSCRVDFKIDFFKINKQFNILFFCRKFYY